jgi:hypothetical protein
LGSLDWDAGANNTGGVALVAGRPAEPDGRTRVVCAPLLVFEGPTANDQMGRSVAALGDVDGDGCDEVAFGASGDDTGGLSNQGAVYVLFGWGGPRCPATPQVVKLQVAQSNAQLGYALAAGDVDGDGAPDLVAGAVGHRHENQTVGGAWVSPGRYLRTLPRADLATAALAPGVPVAPDDATWVVHGEAVDERAGSAVAVVAGRVAVGAIFAEASGTPLVGVVRVHPAGPSGLDQRPWAVFHGETWRPSGRVGEVLSARGRDLLIAGWDGQGAGLDAGSAYWVRLPAE